MQFTKSYSYVFHWRKQVIYRFKMTWWWVNVDSRLLKLPWECDCSQLCAVDDLFTGYSESWFSLKMYGKLCPFCMDVQIKQPVKFPSTWISHHCLFNALWKQQLELSRLNCRSNHNVFEIHGNKLECGSNATRQSRRRSEFTSSPTPELDGFGWQVASQCMAQKRSLLSEFRFLKSIQKRLRLISCCTAEMPLTLRYVPR